MLHTSTASFTPVLDADWRNHLSHGDIVMSVSYTHLTLPTTPYV